MATTRAASKAKATSTADTLRSLAPATSADTAVSTPLSRLSPATDLVALTPAPNPGSPLPEDPRVPPIPLLAPEIYDDNIDEQDPVDNPVPDADNEDQVPEITLAQSLSLLAKNLGKFSDKGKSRNSVKPRHPDTFDGSNPNKLETFIFQCSLYISARASDFPDEESRVNFAMSFLTGSALDWFSSELSQAIDENLEYPAWYTSYPRFVAELKSTFGPRDPANDATNALENLRYKDSGKAVRYTVEFNKHARRTGWNGIALTRQYYKGLPDRLKDEVSRVGKPSDLLELQALVATLDQRHWERQSEISRDRKPAQQTKGNSSDKVSDKPQTNKSDSNKGNKGIHKPKPSSSGTPSSSSAPKINTIANLLGADGKLKPEERQRRMDNRLCLRCGGSGHMANDCPRTSKPIAKGRATTTAPPKKEAKVPAKPLEAAKDSGKD
jgi:Domain of unknown function (DUF4939)/Zinc knuckle